MNLNINQLLLCFSILELSSAFTCYKCSYSLWSEGSRRECIESPDSLGFDDRLQCNSTSFCVLSEQYDIGQNVVTSYFRTCSGTSWGNECQKDASHVTCKATCQGNYCNKQHVGQLHKEYMRRHSEDDRFKGGVAGLHGSCGAMGILTTLAVALAGVMTSKL